VKVFVLWSIVADVSEDRSAFIFRIKEGIIVQKCVLDPEDEDTTFLRNFGKYQSTRRNIAKTCISKVELVHILNQWGRYGSHKPRGERGAQTYRIRKFVVGSFGVDSVLTTEDSILFLRQKTVFWIPVKRSGSNCNNNYSPPPDYRVSSGKGGPPVIYATVLNIRYTNHRLRVPVYMRSELEYP
jgi:hypothetical protein